MQKIRKAVFPVAGLGSRFLPATKAQPKEMLTVVDKPLIQYAVEEAVAAGITEMIFVTGRNKRAIEDHFDTAYELEAELEAAGKTFLLDLVQNVIPKSVHCIYIRQAAALGLGHAVLCARPVVGDEPFAVMLADDLMDAFPSYPSAISQLVSIYDEYQCSVVAVQEIDPQLSTQYGIVSLCSEDFATPRLRKMKAIVEKPAPLLAPSNLGVVGRYIFTPAIFAYLEKLGKGAGGEIQLTDAISMLLRDLPVLSYHADAIRYDCGSKLGYLKASIAFGLKHPEIGQELRRYLHNVEKSDVVPLEIKREYAFASRH